VGVTGPFPRAFALPKHQILFSGYLGVLYRNVGPGDLNGFGEFPGCATKEMVLSVAIVDLLQSKTVCEGAANTPKFKTIITPGKTVGPAYEPLCREQVATQRFGLVFISKQILLGFPKTALNFCFIKHDPGEPDVVV
jgi:hypothetical protein